MTYKRPTKTQHLPEGDWIERPMKDREYIAYLEEMVRKQKIVGKQLSACLEALCGELELSMPDDPHEFNAENIWVAERNARACLVDFGEGQ